MKIKKRYKEKLKNLVKIIKLQKILWQERNGYFVYYRSSTGSKRLIAGVSLFFNKISKNGGIKILYSLGLKSRVENLCFGR